MGIIQQETAARIWECYREITSAEKLLKDMEDKRKQYPDDPHAQCLKDCFGRARGLQLGVPSGENAHRLFNVSPILGETIIKAHIAEKNRELIELNEIARIEINDER